jgi:hypothetical protein
MRGLAPLSPADIAAAPPVSSFAALRPTVQGTPNDRRTHAYRVHSKRPLSNQPTVRMGTLGATSLTKVSVPKPSVTLTASTVEVMIGLIPRPVMHILLFAYGIVLIKN